jgi:hypothetical protein
MNASAERMPRLTASLWALLLGGSVGLSML